jgi:hypothetical protein
MNRIIIIACSCHRIASIAMKHEATHKERGAMVPNNAIRLPSREEVNSCFHYYGATI